MKTSTFATFAPEIVSQLRNYGKLMRVDKPIGIWLLMWPTLWALWLAGEGAPDQALLIDMPSRRAYFFWIEIWPQEVYYLTGLMILAAVVPYLYFKRRGWL